MPSEGGVDPLQAAFFFDFDGTLAEIVDDPLAVRVTEPVLAAVERLHEATSGALAIVSGRSVSQLQAHLQPLELPFSGVHGQQLLYPDGTLEDTPYDDAVHGELVSRANDFARGKTGIIVETKPGSVALHYRMAPEWEARCREFAAFLATEYPQVHLMHGKMVLEFKMGARTKGDAIRAFMKHPTFAGRIPVFFGDDVTDEYGFRAVQALGGVGFKVGTGETAADYRFTDIAAFHRWLSDLVASLEAGAQALALPGLDPARGPYAAGSAVS